jgi:esterase/lipase superfamily enzyme
VLPVAFAFDKLMARRNELTPDDRPGFPLNEPAAMLREPTAEVLMDGYFDSRLYFHMPSHYVPNLHDQGALERLRRLHIVLAVGEHDPFLDNNLHLSRHLRDKDVGHEFYIWQGRAHRPQWWKEMVRVYL